MYSKIDKIDIIILEKLIKDGRATYAEIAKETQLTDVAIKKRIESLKRRGIIKSIRAELNYVALGFEKFLLLQIRTELGKTEDIINRLKKNDYVLEIYRVLGEFNIIVKAAFPNMEIAERFLSEIGKIDGIIDTKSFFILSSYSKECSLPVFFMQNKLR